MDWENSDVPKGFHMQEKPTLYAEELVRYPHVLGVLRRAEGWTVVPIPGYHFADGSIEFRLQRGEEEISGLRVHVRQIPGEVRDAWLEMVYRDGAYCGVCVPRCGERNASVIDMDDRWEDRVVGFLEELRRCRYLPAVYRMAEADMEYFAGKLGTENFYKETLPEIIRVAGLERARGLSVLRAEDKEQQKKWERVWSLLDAATELTR